MGLYKNLDLSFSDTIKAGYHRITEFSFNSETGACTVQLKSYISKSDADAGKDCVGVRSFSLSVQPSVELYASIQNLLETSIQTQLVEFGDATLG